MNRALMLALVAICLAIPVSAIGQQRDVSRPGAQPHIPSRIDWLTTTLQAGLRIDMTLENKFLLQITSPDSETILIYVRYLPDVQREIMNLHVDSAREVIRLTAKSYGWDSWLKVREDIQIGKAGRPRVN